MKKILVTILLVLTTVTLTMLDNQKNHRIFIERSEKNLLTVSNASSYNLGDEKKDIVMSVILNYDPFGDEIYYQNNDYYDFDSYIETSKAYHYEFNTEYHELLKIDSDDVFISEYTPFIYYYFDENSFDEIYHMATEFIDELFVDSVYLYEPSLYESQSTAEAKEMINDYQEMELLLTDYREFINYDNFPKGTPYTGLGIKIGIFDTGIFNPNHQNFSDVYAEVTYDTYTANNNSSSAQHPTWVASVLGGKYGIANEASLYYVDANSQSGFTAIEKLINKGVHVINMSIASKTYYNNGEYSSSQEAYLDYMYVSTRVVMIAATGNSLNVEGSGGYIALPALASNIIAVGSVTSIGNMAQSSSYNNKNDIKSKPNLVAVGASRSIPNFGTKSGSSFSAPAVTGAVALFFQKRGVKDMPATLAALSVTADNDGVSKNTQTIEMRQYNSSNDTYTNTGNTTSATNYQKSGSGLHERSGAGKLDIKALLNYDRAFIGGTYTLTSTDYVTLNSYIYLSAGQTITAALAWQRNATKKTEWIFWTTYTSAPLADLDIALTNTTGTVFKKTSATYTNTELFRHTVTTSGIYQLRFKPYSNYTDLKYINYAYIVN